MDQKQDKEASPTTDRKQRIDELLLLIGGLEVSIRIAIKTEDWDFRKILKTRQAEYYEKLRRVSYGLSEDRTPKSAKQS